MTFEQRQPVDYFSTSLIVAASITDTTMRAAGFTALDSPLGQKYVALVLHDDAQGVYEIVWTSGHAIGSDTITVVRGKQGTTARAWPAGTRVECAPTVYDALYPSVTATLPTDAPIGMRSMRGDKFDAVERVNGYWGPSVGVALAADVGPNMNGVQPPDGAVILQRIQYVAPFNTSATGDKTVNFKTAFPNNCLSVSLTSVTYNAAGPFVVYAMSASSVSFTVYNGNATRTQLNSISCLLQAWGW